MSCSNCLYQTMMIKVERSFSDKHHGTLFIFNWQFIFTELLKAFAFITSGEIAKFIGWLLGWLVSSLLNYFMLWSVIFASNYTYLPHHFAWEGYNAMSIFQWRITVLNSEFSFSLSGCHTKVKEPSLSYYLPIAGGKIYGCIPFLKYWPSEKCKQPYPGFELRSLYPFPMPITITPMSICCWILRHINLYWVI